MRWYSPSTGRWFSRDPIGEPGFQVLQAANASPRVGSPVPLPPGRFINRNPRNEKGGMNLYVFVRNNPIVAVDPFGLDVWVFHSYGGFGHEWVVGSNPDGTYWDSNFHPNTSSWHCPLLLLPCEGIIDFVEKSAFNPSEPRTDGYFYMHVVTDASVDAKVRTFAARASELSQQSHPWWATWWPGFNCHTYATAVADYARRP
jgi:hypothetical protein